jgi:hypothetical protein
MDNDNFTVVEELKKIKSMVEDMRTQLKENGTYVGPVTDDMGNPVKDESGNIEMYEMNKRSTQKRIRYLQNEQDRLEGYAWSERRPKNNFMRFFQWLVRGFKFVFSKTYRELRKRTDLQAYNDEMRATMENAAQSAQSHEKQNEVGQEQPAKTPVEYDEPDEEKNGKIPENEKKNNHTKEDEEKIVKEYIEKMRENSNCTDEKEFAKICIADNPKSCIGFKEIMDADLALYTINATFAKNQAKFGEKADIRKTVYSIAKYCPQIIKGCGINEDGSENKKGICSYAVGLTIRNPEVLLYIPESYKWTKNRINYFVEDIERNKRTEEKMSRIKELAETTTDEKSKEIYASFYKKATEAVQEFEKVHSTEKGGPDIPDAIPNTIPDNIPDTIPDNIPNTIPDNIPDTIPDNIPDNIPDTIPDNIPDDIPDNIPDDIPDYIPDAIPDDIPDYMPQDGNDYPNIPEENIPDTSSADAFIAKNFVPDVLSQEELSYIQHAADCFDISSPSFMYTAIQNDPMIIKAIKPEEMKASYLAEAFLDAGPDDHIEYLIPETMEDNAVAKNIYTRAFERNNGSLQEAADDIYNTINDLKEKSNVNDLPIPDQQMLGSIFGKLDDYISKLPNVGYVEVGETLDDSDLDHMPNIFCEQDGISDQTDGNVIDIMERYDQDLDKNGRVHDIRTKSGDYEL